MLNSGDLLGAWSAAMGRACWQGGLVVLLIAVFCRLLPTMPARVQCWFWRLAILKFLLVLLWPVPVSLPLLPTRAEVRPEIDWSVSGRDAVMAGGSVSERPRRVETAAAGLESTLICAVLFTAWLLGVGVASWRLLTAWRHGAAVIRRTRPLPDSGFGQQFCELCRTFAVRRTPALLQADGDGSPLVIGVLRPAIVFPAVTWERLNDGERALAVEHELAHVKRADLFWSLLAAFMRAVLFFHPLVWLCERQLRLSQELAADELTVTGRRYDPISYAKLLVSIVGKLGPARRLPTVSLATAGPQHSLRKRILAMQWIGQTTRPATVAAATLLAAITLLGLVPWTLVAAEETRELQIDARVVDGPEGKVQIDARFLDVPEGASRKALAALKPAGKVAALLTADQTATFLDKLQASKDVQLLSTPKVITLLGRPAKVQIGRELPVRTDDVDASFEGLSLEFEGFSLEVMPKSKGQKLTLDIVAIRRIRIPDADQPAFRETRIDTRLIMPAGHTAVLAGTIDEHSREMLLLISAKRLFKAAAETSRD